MSQLLVRRKFNAQLRTVLYVHPHACIAGEDYVAINKSVVFAFGFELVQCVHIPILDNYCYEDFLQSFNISLSSDHERVDFEVDEFPVYILDDDRKLTTLHQGYCKHLLNICISSIFSQ